MNNALISIIVPMFNEEDNILNCINILRQQTIQSFSVIFIDDGSTDATLITLQERIIKSDINFSYSILQQANQGAAKAREVAIRSCKTPYILIFDTDDHISPDTIEKTEKSIKEFQCDISLPDLHIQQKDNSYQILNYPNNQHAFSSSEALQYTLGKWLVPGVMCAKTEIFIKSYDLYNQFNPEELNYMNNDEVISRLNFFHSQIIVRNYSTYFYQNNQSSTTKKINPNRYLMAKNVQILYDLFGKGSNSLALKTQEEYINVLWGLIVYVRKNKQSLSNVQSWIIQIQALIAYIKPDLKNFKNLSFKSRSRLWQARILVKFL